MGWVVGVEIFNHVSIGVRRCMATVGNSHQASTDGIELLTGEIVLENVHPSWEQWWKWLTAAAGIAVIGVLALANGELEGGLLTLLMSGLLIAAVYIARLKSRYIVTNQRVYKSIGLFGGQTGETRIADIKSVKTEQGFWESFTSRGSVQIDSTGAGGTLGITGIRHYEDVANTIREQQRRLEKEARQN